MRGLAAEGDLVPFHAEGAEHDAEREVQRLEHRALLDVELEIGGGVFELVSGFEGGVEVDAMARERVRKRIAVAVAAAA